MCAVTQHPLLAVAILKLALTPDQIRLVERLVGLQGQLTPLTAGDGLQPQSKQGVSAAGSGRRTRHIANDVNLIFMLNHHVALDITGLGQDRKSTRLNSSHVAISYAVFCLK